MKCSLDRLDDIFKICLLKALFVYSVFNVLCVFPGEPVQGNDILSDFDYLVSQLYLQHCTFVEIGEGVCSLFVELTLDSGSGRPRRRQMFFGNCLCSEFRKWHLCSYPLTGVRREDCEFQEGTSCPATSARVHRRLCDVTGMSQWNPQCNCSVTLAGVGQEFMCGFKTCYANPLPRSICGPRTVCGTAHCDVAEYGSLYGVRCDRRCRNHRPFCEDPCPETSHKRNVTSQWAEWKSVSGSDNECNMKQFETECLGENKEPAFDCLGPGLFCCNKEDSDCICEVKLQDGKMKAFRYMINFGDEKSQCDPQPTSKLRVRSVGLKGDEKVWGRFISAASREDNTSDSVSMFGKPMGFDEYLRKNKVEDNKEMVPETMTASLQNPGKPKEGILHQLVSLVTNHSQLAEKSSEQNNVSTSKSVQGNGSKGESGKLVNQVSMKTPVNTSLESLTAGPNDKQQVNSNVNQLQSNNNSSSNSNTTLQNQLKNPQNRGIDEKSPYHYTPLPYQNITNKVGIAGQSSSVGQNTTESVKNISHSPDEKVISDAKTLIEQSDIYKYLQSKNKYNEQSNSVQQLVQKNRDKEPVAENTKEKSIDSGTNTKGEKTPDTPNKLISFLENNMHQNEEIKDKQNTQQTQKPNAENKVIKSAALTQETAVNKNISQSSNPNEKLQQVLPESIKEYKKLEDKDSENRRIEDRMVLEMIEKSDKLNLNRLIGEGNNRESVAIEQSVTEKNTKDDSESIADKSEENQSLNWEKIEKAGNKYEFLLGGIVMSENKAKNQENSSVDEEDRAELRENENQQGVVPTQSKQKDNKRDNKETKPSASSKQINQVTQLRNQHITPQLVNKDVTPMQINKKFTVKLVNDFKNKHEATHVPSKKVSNLQGKEEKKNSATAKLVNEKNTPKLNNQYITPSLKNNVMRDKLIEKVTTPHIINHNFTARLLKKDFTPKQIKKDFTSKLLDKAITPKISKEVKSNFKNQDFTPQITKQDLTPRLMNQALTPKLVNQALAPKVVNQASTPKLINEALTPTMPNQASTPKLITSNTINKKVTPNLKNQDSTPHLIKQDFTPDLNNQGKTPQLKKQNFTPNLKNQDLTPEKAGLVQDFTSKVMNEDFNKPAQNVNEKPSSKDNLSTGNLVNNKKPEKVLGDMNTGSSVVENERTTLFSQNKQSNNSLPNNVELTTAGIQLEKNRPTNGRNNEEKVIEQGSVVNMLNGTEITANITQLNGTSSEKSSLAVDQPIKQHALDKKVKFNDIANIFPTYNLDEVTVPSTSTKPRPKLDFLQENEENVISLKIQSMTTPNFLGAIAKKLFKSHSESNLNDPNDPFRMISDSNPPISLPEEKPLHDYDEPEPVLKDISKVDKENVDEKMAEALSKLADLKEQPEKVEWSEKSEDNNEKLDLQNNKKLENQKNKPLSRILSPLSIRDFRKKRLKSKLKNYKNG